MFTGIVQEIGIISSKEKTKAGISLEVVVEPTFLKNLDIGASIAVNGVCLTVTKFNQNSVAFDVIPETLRVTNLEEISVSSKVNMERSLKFGDEVGGHLLSGHISCACKASLSNTEGEVEILVDKPENWGQYIYPKGYIALNGVSLTVGKVSDEIFSVYLIPETIRSTNLLTVEDGARLNLEIDQGIMASYENEKKILENTGEDE